MPRIKFDEIDISALLTLITLVGGFIWWAYTTQREWRRKTFDDARSGALRLLLRILREREETHVSLIELHNLFRSPQMKTLRKAYCKRDFRFKNESEFEAAVYRLDWEGKID